MWLPHKLQARPKLKIWSEKRRPMKAKKLRFCKDDPLRAVRQEILGYNIKYKADLCAKQPGVVADWKRSLRSDNAEKLLPSIANWRANRGPLS